MVVVNNGDKSHGIPIRSKKSPTKQIQVWEVQKIHLGNLCLGDGFKYVLFSPLFGEDFQVGEHIFQMGWNHQPDVNLTSPKILNIFTSCRAAMLWPTGPRLGLPYKRHHQKRLICDHATGDPRVNDSSFFHLKTGRWWEKPKFSLCVWFFFLTNIQTLFFSLLV